MPKKVNPKQIDIGNEINKSILGEYMDSFKCNPDESAGLDADFESPPATPIDGEISEDGYWAYDEEHERWVELPFGPVKEKEEYVGIGGIDVLKPDGESDPDRPLPPGINPDNPIIKPTEEDDDNNDADGGSEG